MSEKLQPNVVVCEADATRLLYLFTMYMADSNDRREYSTDETWIRQRQIESCLALATKVQARHIPIETDEEVPIDFMSLPWQEAELIKQAHQLAGGEMPELSSTEDWPSPKPEVRQP